MQPSRLDKLARKPDKTRFNFYTYNTQERGQWAPQTNKIAFYKIQNDAKPIFSVEEPAAVDTCSAMKFCCTHGTYFFTFHNFEKTYGIAKKYVPGTQ